MGGSPRQGGPWRWGERARGGPCGQGGGHNRRRGRLGSVLAQPCPVALPGAQLPSGHGHMCAERPEAWRAPSEDLGSRDCGCHVADTQHPLRRGLVEALPLKKAGESSPGQPQRPCAQAGAGWGGTPAPQVFIELVADGIQIRALCLRLSLPDLVPRGEHPRAHVDLLHTVTPTGLPRRGRRPWAARARRETVSARAAPSVVSHFRNLKTPRLLRVVQ